MIISDKIGKSSETDLSFITTQAIYSYAKTLQNSLKEPAVSFKTEFSKSNPELIMLMTDLLQMNPHFRPSAEDCL